ncbi:MAG: antitoxin Xre/MbcA/ParS toxin-binding domain-containing protein [Pseudomonadota bacterium]
MTALDLGSHRGDRIASTPARLAQMLSLEVPMDFDDVALARQVSEGLPAKAVTRLAGFFGRGKIVGPVVPEPTLRRARKARKALSREHSERLYELSRVLDAASRAYRGDRDRIMAFMTRPHPLLDGEAPFDLARSSSAGADAVLNLLDRAEAGVAL